VKFSAVRNDGDDITVPVESQLLFGPDQSRNGVSVWHRLQSVLTRMYIAQRSRTEVCATRLEWLTENSIAILPDMATCMVSYLDTSGIRHSVEVDAESLYEAAVLAIKVFRQHDCEPHEANHLEIEVRSSVVHTLTMRKIQNWLNGGAKTPKEAVTKERLRSLL
jgi:hypothetical protein